MPVDPMEEWRRLTQLYSEMGDLEIRELASQINDLVPAAQQVLRDELKKRGFTQRLPPEAQRTGQFGEAVHWQQEDDTAADRDEEGSEEDSRGYTWKIALCRCETRDEAAARSEMLRRAGIESWIQTSASRFVVPWLETGVGDNQVNVAADQLDHARTILAQPIPQEIIDQLKAEATAPAFEFPRCPRCQAEDPILESVDPSNNWLCESCGHSWSDPLPDSGH